MYIIQKEKKAVRKKLILPLVLALFAMVMMVAWPSHGFATTDAATNSPPETGFNPIAFAIQNADQTNAPPVVAALYDQPANDPNPFNLSAMAFSLSPDMTNVLAGQTVDNQEIMWTRGNARDREVTSPRLKWQYGVIVRFNAYSMPPEDGLSQANPGSVVCENQYPQPLTKDDKSDIGSPLIAPPSKVMEVAYVIIGDRPGSGEGGNACEVIASTVAHVAAMTA